MARLDPAFGHAGRLTLPFGSQTERQLLAAVTQDGGLVLGNGRLLRRISPTGGLDRSFGKAGTLTPTAPSGGSFEVEGMTVDSQDRLVVAGTSDLPDEPIPSTPGFLAGESEGPLAARIARYLPDGSPDPSFGEGGAVETDLGLPPPRDSSGQQIIARPWVEATGVVTDPQDRVVLTGGASAGVHYWCFHDWSWNTLTYAAFVARLTQSGTLDTTFGGSDGVIGGRTVTENPLQAEVSADPQVGPGGELSYLAGIGHCAVPGGSAGLARLTESGTPQTSFGSEGSVSGGFAQAKVEPDGSTVVIERLPWRKGGPARSRVRRLLPNGSPDLSFGTNGRTLLSFPGEFRNGLTSLAIGPDGGILLAGVNSTERQHRDPGGNLDRTYRSHWLLMRLNPGGQLDRSFGRSGRIATRFGALIVGGPVLLPDPRGGTLVVSRYRSPSGKHGFAVARYKFDG